MTPFQTQFFVPALTVLIFCLSSLLSISFSTLNTWYSTTMATTADDDTLSAALLLPVDTAALKKKKKKSKKKATTTTVTADSIPQ